MATDVDPASPTVTITPAPKPGYKTTEFWLSLLAIAIGAAVSTGLIPSTGEAAKVAAFATMLLAALGYTAARAAVKVNP